MKYVTNQQKKNLRLRALKLFNAIRNQTNLSMEIRFRGSLAKKQNVKKKSDGSFDLDFDIRISSIGKYNADQTYNLISKAVKNALRSSEIFDSKENVIRIFNEINEVKYHYDIAIYHKKQNKFSKLIKKNSIFKWGKLESDPYEVSR